MCSAEGRIMDDDMEIWIGVWIWDGGKARGYQSKD